ncbi:MAG: hypothetical protein JNL39_07340 [Opitutaceae bacterium]|nr:hypothetical protein [Opitutaceae bacterium]
MRPFLLAILLAPLGAVAQSHPELHADAARAAAAGDLKGARTAISAALAQRPDSPRYLRELAAYATQGGDAPAAIAALRRIATLGLAPAVERDPLFAPLQGTRDFREVGRLFAENREPRGEVTALAELPGRNGLIEGIAFRARTGDLFLGDVHHRCIWRRRGDGPLERFSVETEDALGIFGLAIDEPRGALWAAMTAGPEISGFTADLKGLAALAEFDLSTGELRRIVDLPDDARAHALGDLIVAADGTVYATDSLAPVIWRVTPGAEEAEVFTESDSIHSLQGLVLAGRALVVADFANGLLTVDLAARRVTRIATPPGTTLVGLDGLVAEAETLVAVQNGTTPQRVLRLRLAPDLASVESVVVLASGHPGLDDLGLVTLMRERPIVVAGAGWDLLSPGRPQPPAHTVRVFALPAP